MTTLAWLLAILPIGGLPAADKLFLRDGEVVTSSKITGNGLGYNYTERGESKFIAREKVAFYISQENAGQSPHKFEDTMASGELLPTKVYGEKYMKDLGAATRTMDIFAYFVSELDSPVVETFVEALKAAVQRKVTVRLILSNDPGTNFGVRECNLDFAKEITKHGIAVRLSNSRQLMHKKGAIIDGSILYLGSSNISYYSLVGGDNMNIRVQNCPTTIKNSNDMFENLWERCQPPK